jgi:hypothetical protein
MNIHFVLRDKQEIFGIYNSLEDAYAVLLHFIYNFFRYSKHLNNNDNIIVDLISYFQIISYSNNIINNIYNLNKHFKLQDYNSEIIKLNTITLNDLVNKSGGVYINLLNDLSIYFSKNNNDKSINKLGLIITKEDNLLYIGVLVLFLSFLLWLIDITR